MVFVMVQPELDLGDLRSESIVGIGQFRQGIKFRIGHSLITFRITYCLGLLTIYPFSRGIKSICADNRSVVFLVSLICTDNAYLQKILKQFMEYYHRDTIMAADIFRRLAEGLLVHHSDCVDVFRPLLSNKSHISAL
jgi:hypothetical protein